MPTPGSSPARKTSASPPRDVLTRNTGTIGVGLARQAKPASDGSATATRSYDCAAHVKRPRSRPIPSGGPGLKMDASQAGGCNVATKRLIGSGAPGSGGTASLAGPGAGRLRLPDA